MNFVHTILIHRAHAQVAQCNYVVFPSLFFPFASFENDHFLILIENWENVKVKFRFWIPIDSSSPAETITTQWG